MAEKFDELAKNLATQQELPRRRMLGQLAAAMGGGLVALFAGERSAAAAPPVKCPPGLTNCDGVCRDTAVNADHCGTCGNVCAAGEMCRSGVCVACTCAQPCPSGQTRCGGTCVNLQTDPTHCGSCTTVCASGQVCVNGQCSTGCPSGQTNCGGECVNLQTDPRHCGACSQTCLDHGPCVVAACQDGQCTHFAVADGCEDGNPCTNGICDVSTGNCSFVPVADGTACPDGTCQNGTCVASGGGGNGQPCSSPSQCASGFCVGGICCNSSCDGVCATCGTGTCTPRPSTTVCRAQAGPCDVAEFCDGASFTCPPNEFAPFGTSCPGGYCNGSSATCQPGSPP